MNKAESKPILFMRYGVEGPKVKIPVARNFRCRPHWSRGLPRPPAEWMPVGGQARRYSGRSGVLTTYRLLVPGCECVGHLPSVPAEACHEVAFTFTLLLQNAPAKRRITLIRCV
jgi:hypothetical protein